MSDTYKNKGCRCECRENTPPVSIVRGNDFTLFGVPQAGERHVLEWNYYQGIVLVDGDSSVGKIVGTASSVATTNRTCYLFAIDIAGYVVDGNGNDWRRGWQKLHRF